LRTPETGATALWERENGLQLDRELRQALHQRILATFKTWAFAGAGAGHLPLGATAGSFTLAGSNATAHALRAFVFRNIQFIVLHDF